MRTEIYKGRIVTLVTLDDHWEVVEHADAVAILVADGRRILGVWQHRPAVGHRTWEIPAGLIDPGEEPRDAAARELAEEVQLAGHLSLVTTLYASPGFTDERVYLYEATGTRPELGLERDESEDLGLEWRDALDVWRALAGGEEVTSGVTALALRHLLASLGEAV
ncbi:MAG TPA: NUDIX hydrolase [Trueperaceae bacterium]|nr:NUDIX hydrolase [Trueperaceae bacterium]